ncbi:antirestriction protein ArdA [Corynebacterium sp. CCM 9204]|uniref:antirestriction protein ArdA n=1 Tax=Corynebacterium sp. CCM 9204 TaxID=3057616 RepID=UPI00352572B7
MTITDTTPRVWPACLNCYNNGRLVGRWVDCTDVSDVTITSLHDGFRGPYSGCEEIWCIDHENLPVKGEIGLAESGRWGDCFEEADPDQWPAVCAWVSSGCYIAEGTGDIPSMSQFEDAYQGQWDSFDDYATQLAEDIALTDDWPEEAQRYFNWEAWSRDLAFDYTVIDAPDGGVFVFRNC